jgi:Beta-xylosidase
MKKTHLHIILVLFLLNTASALADYPIFYQRYTADPWGLEYKGRLYLFCSHDTYDPKKGYGYFMNDITCISTDDMKNWTDHGEVFHVKDSKWGATLSWAPSVVYKGGEFYLYYGNGSDGIGVAVSDSPTGQFVDNNKGPLVDRNTPGVLPGGGPWGMWCFDPSVLVDEGQVYMYFGGSDPSNSRIIKLKDNMVEADGAAVKANTPGFFEGSYVHKYKGKYYYSYAGHYFSTPANIEYVMSDNPISGFGNPGLILPNPPVNDDFNNHHSIFQFKGDWYITYHNRQVAHENGIADKRAREYMRNVCIDRLYYNEDGTIRKVTITRDGLKQLKYINPYTRNEAETMAKGLGINTRAISGSNRAVDSIDNGDYLKIRGVNFSSGAKLFKAVVASVNKGGEIEICLDSLNGRLLGTCLVNGTGSWQNRNTKSCKVANVKGIHDLYLKFRGVNGSLFDLDWWAFEKK